MQTVLLLSFSCFIWWKWLYLWTPCDILLVVMGITVYWL